MRFGSGRTGLLQDSTTGSIIVNQDGHQDDSIQMHSLSEGNDEKKNMTGILIYYKINREKEEIIKFLIIHIYIFRST